MAEQGWSSFSSPEAVVVVGLFPAALSSVDTMPEKARLDVMKPFAAAGAMIIDSGLSFRSDAAHPEIVDRLSQANVIYLSFGRPELLLDAVLGTPTYDALVGASDRGAIVMGFISRVDDFGMRHVQRLRERRR